MSEYTDDLKKDIYVSPKMEIIFLDREDAILTSLTYPGEALRGLPVPPARPQAGRLTGR